MYKRQGEGGVDAKREAPVFVEAEAIRGSQGRPGADVPAPVSPSPLDRSKSGMSEDEWGGADLELPGM